MRQTLTWERARECERLQDWQSHCCSVLWAAPGHTGSWSLQQAGDLVIAVQITHVTEHSSLNGTALTGLLTFVCSLAVITCLISGETIKNICTLILHKPQPPVLWVVFAEEVAFRKKRLCIKFIPRDSTEAAICDIRILGRSKQAPPQYTFIG